MMRKLPVALLGMTLFLFAPTVVSAASVCVAGVMEMDIDQDINVTYSEGALNVTGAEGLTLEVIALTGKKVMSQAIVSPSQRIELNIPKGCYIVKVGNMVRKISIR